ncbi:copia protein [Tanacetum coccineum]
MVKLFNPPPSSFPQLASRARFETYVKSKDIDLWHIIVYVDYKPIIKNKDTGNKQVKDNKIDLFVQYEEFVISDDETIDCAFASFNTIITSLKALDESFSSRNHVRKFLRALPTKWRPKVTTIEESKYLSTLTLDELIGNLKVYRVVLEKDLEASKTKKEKYKSLAPKAKKVSSDEETSCSGSDEEYEMAEEKKGKEDQRFFKCGDPNHFISDYPKHSFNDQKAFVGGCWSDSEEEDDSKKDGIYKNGVVSRNKARLIAQGYNKLEGIDIDETYSPVARLESIRILLAYACAHDFNLFQMDVKSAFLNGLINEEVYVSQLTGFVDFEKPNHVFKVKKALYGLKQAPKAWYDRLNAFLLDHKYTMGLVDNTLFAKKRDSHIIIVQIYMDDVIFGSTC